MAQRSVAAICTAVLWLAVRAGAQESVLREAARLDAQQQCEGAERLYRQALAQGPATLPLLNNLGNHYVVCGDAEKARAYFERAIRISPGHPNANFQLARLAADRHEGARALEYLARVNDSGAATRLLRVEALHWAGRKAEALALLDGVQKETPGNSQLAYLYALTCARIGAYERAETAFNAVLAGRPADFDILFNLGRTAARAGHYDRALRALEVAARQRPDDVDCLLELAEVNQALGDYARAIYVLVQAKRLAPARSEILLALARASRSGEYYGDAALAYDDYLRLKPGDDAARRDRALVCGFTDTRQAEGLKELTWYAGKHPTDPLGHYDLAQLTWRDQPQQALEQLTAALRLDPRLAPAHVDLGWLLNRLGRTADAVPHFQKALEIGPRNARAMDQLGAAYIALDRPAEAEKVLRRAAAILPDDPEIMMHLGRALMESGREDEARPILERFQKTRIARARGPWKQPGMIESASLPAAERNQREIERLRSDAKTHPDDPELQLRLAGLLLADGRTEEAGAEFRTLAGRNADARTWQEAGSLLLGFDQYQLAREFLERAAAAQPAANLDLATAVFFLEGPTPALRILEQAPAGERSGDFLLLKAKLLDAAGRADESEQVLEQGLAFSISRPRIAREAVLLLVRHGRKERALEFLGKAAGNNPDLLLARAVVLALMDRSGAADQDLKQIESEWPEWDQPYVVHGLLLERTRPNEARVKLRTALALGSREIAAQCAAARLESTATPESRCACAGGIYELWFPKCGR